MNHTKITEHQIENPTKDHDGQTTLCTDDQNENPTKDHDGQTTLCPNKLTHNQTDIKNEFTQTIILTILENLSMGIIVVSDEKIISYHNSTAEALLKQKIKNENFDLSFSDQFFGFSMRQTLNQKEAITGHILQIEYEQGNLHEFTIDANYIHEINSSILMIRDVTEIRRLEMINQRLNRLNELGEIASIVAHEIRNPLGGIKGFASLLERDLKDLPNEKKLATYILQGADSLNNIVTRVLEYARPIQTELRQGDLLKVIHDMKDKILKQKNYNEKINIFVNCLEDKFNVFMAIDQMQIALYNLLENSCQAITADQGQIEINLSQNKTRGILDITDNGQGIAPSNLKKIFSPFFTTKTDGNGFGLCEVHKIIEAHQGTIDVISKEGEGTTVKITLPLKLDQSP